MSSIGQVEPVNWQEFLQEFSIRNYNRRSRFEVFKKASVEEEKKEAHLEAISLQKNGDKSDIVVIRIDRSDSDAEKIRDVITNVRGLSVQYDTDGSENILEITDDENTLIQLRMESRVDGAS
jgi:hypothetical protein